MVPYNGICEFAGINIRCTAGQRPIDEASMGDGNSVDPPQFWAHVRRSLLSNLVIVCI